MTRAGTDVVTDVRMPRLSDSMEDGTILAWLHAPGDGIRSGEELVEIETDKASMVYEADAAGTLWEILAPAGATVIRRIPQVRSREFPIWRATGEAGRSAWMASRWRCMR